MEFRGIHLAEIAGPLDPVVPRRADGMRTGMTAPAGGSRRLNELVGGAEISQDAFSHGD